MDNPQETKIPLIGVLRTVLGTNVPRGGGEQLPTKGIQDPQRLYVVLHWFKSVDEDIVQIQFNNCSTMNFLLPLLVGGPDMAKNKDILGSIKNNTKRYLPKILIVFSLNDNPLAEKLISITKVGKLYNKPQQGCVI